VSLTKTATAPGGRVRVRPWRAGARLLRSPSGTRQAPSRSRNLRAAIAAGIQGREVWQWRISDFLTVFPSSGHRTARRFRGRSRHAPV